MEHGCKRRRHSNRYHGNRCLMSAPPPRTLIQALGHVRRSRASTPRWPPITSRPLVYFAAWAGGDGRARPEDEKTRIGCRPSRLRQRKV
ncbi:uncharacterized protein ACBT44_008075 isoform 2-T2 [Syngnathus typhle]